ncbi:MAG TPA: LamB/YcsF family protein [Firmicutes bacterium]|nr:LamB/YcsF family protein [Candidatus Fermentithermobacillaceae bacterium]
MPYIDLNTDTGESFGRWVLGDDERLLSYVTSANIACGLHAGDPVVMDRVSGICAEKGVSIGAHPGYPDLQGFGRREIKMAPSEIESFIVYQVGAVKAFARSLGKPLTHVKPHGSLYNMAASDEKIAAAVARGVARCVEPGETIILVGLAGSLSLEAARKVGLPYAAEGFCDRAYNSDGSLVSRLKPGSVLHDPDQIAERAVAMVNQGSVISYDGKPVNINVDTLCIHSDTPGAPDIARAVREALERAGVDVLPLSRSAGR